MNISDKLNSKEQIGAALNLKPTDCIEGRGWVQMKLINKITMEVVDEFEDHNLIVKTGRSELIKLLVKQSTKSITKMSIGKGGANIATDPFTPLSPVDGDTALGSQVGIVNISSAVVDTTSTNPKVTFVALFDCEVIKSLVNEVGLVFDDNVTMFARHTFKTVSLESGTDFALQVTWATEF